LGHSNLSKPDPFCGIIINPWLGVGMICAGNGPAGFTRIFGPREIWMIPGETEEWRPKETAYLLLRVIYKWAFFIS